MNAGLPAWVDASLAVVVVAGTAFALIGSWGLARLSDFAKRLHGPTKATTLGVGGVLVASMLAAVVGPEPLSLHELLITLFLFVTAPVSALLLVKAALKLDPTLKVPPPPIRPDAPPSAKTPTTRFTTPGRRG